MSLLNDALKAAEQRQDRPPTSPYTGQGTAAPTRRGNTGKLLAVVGILVILGAGAWYLYPGSATPPAPTAVTQPEQDSPAPATADSGPATGSAAIAPEEVIPPPADMAQPSVDESDAVDVNDAPEAVEQGTPGVMAQSFREPDTQPGAAQPEVTTPSSPAPEPAANAEDTAAPAVEEPDPEPVQQGPQAPAQTASTSDTEPAPRNQPETALASEAPTESQPAADADIKQTRQTAAQRDRDASKEIGNRIASGELTAAEATLTGITGTQTAPQSRYVFARAVLARGDVDRALAWVPEDMAAGYPDLRLIRARALLAGGDLNRAVATLLSSVPPVADNTEYRVTLATLLQQQGLSDQAANHWAQLIALDDSQAPWWVGLAIALEGRGEVPAARRAYQQAAALPGLAPSLADYVRQRLQSLGAG